MKSEIELFVIERVRELRESKNISQAALAKMLQVSTGFIGQVESRNNPAKYNLNHLNELSRVFNCSMSEFLPSDFIEANLETRTRFELEEEF